MPLTCFIGPSLTFDVIAYIRGMTEDTSTTPKVPDSTLALYIEVAAEEFSKWVPLGEHVVGLIGAVPPTSPMNTIVNQSRYPLSVANGFIYPVLDVTDVSFTPTGILNAADESAYQRLIPASPYPAFVSSENAYTTPSSRIIRAGVFNEMAHYRDGFWSVARDASGLKAIDIYPVPSSAGIPIFVRYTSPHIAVVVNGNPTYPTVPEDLKRYFAKFALVEVLEQEAERLGNASQFKAGVMQKWTSPAGIKKYASELRADLEVALGSSVTIGMVSH